MPASNGWDTSASRAIHCCASCWEKQRKQPHVATRTGDVGCAPDDAAGKSIAKVAMARKLAVRLYWMWRNNWQYSQLVEFGSSAGKLGTVHGVK